MKSVVVVGLNLSHCQKISEFVCCELGFTFKNLSNEIHKVLLNSELMSGNTKKMESKETAILKKVAGLQNCVFALELDSFLSNKNYKIFKQFFVILVEEDEKDINKLIQKFARKRTNYSLNYSESKANPNELKEILKKYKNCE